MKIKDKRLTILSEIEEFAFYGLPDFDDEQRATYFTFTQEEIDDPSILENVHRSQNRVESYHGLRAAIAKTTGRKALIGQTDLEMEISNECGRLIASAIIYYNASIQSRLLERSPKSRKIMKFLKKSSPVAWSHIHFTGHFVFYSDK